jgi:hypothetical protein
MPQKHDQGWKKQQPAAKSEPLLNTEHLARLLVENGLASPQILDPRPDVSRRTKADS